MLECNDTEGGGDGQGGRKEIGFCKICACEFAKSSVLVQFLAKKVKYLF